MLQRLKINIASCICIAFIFRLLFINLGVVSSFYAQSPNSQIKNQKVSFTKSNTYIEESHKLTDSGDFIEEIFEEDIDDENHFKLDVFLITHIFYSVLKSKIKNQLKNITSFNKHFSYNSTHRFIEFGVFRL